MGLAIVTREAWEFDGPLGRALTLPLQNVWLHHSTTNPTSDPHADARLIERIGRQRFGRLSYSFLIHPTGTILQGQDTHKGAHTFANNSNAMGIVWIGDYHTGRPTRALIHSTARLLNHFASTGRAPNRITGGHRDVRATACPGDHAYSTIADINTLATRTPHDHDQEEAMTVPLRWIGRGNDRDPVALVFSDGHKIEVARSKSDAAARSLGEVFGVPFRGDQAAKAPNQAYDGIPSVA